MCVCVCVCVCVYRFNFNKKEKQQEQQQQLMFNVKIWFNAMRLFKPIFVQILVLSFITQADQLQPYIIFFLSKPNIEGGGGRGGGLEMRGC